MKAKKVKVGLIGFGTVGTGVVKILQENADSIQAKTGLEIELSRVVDLDITTDRGVTLPDGGLTDDLDLLIEDNSIDIGIELIGGTTVAKDIQIKLLEAGKDVVTANKALLAEHGNELYIAAGKNKRSIAFEASCVGGVPIVSALRTGLAANRIDALYGIMNGTCNYILTKMTEFGLDFDSVLKEAQEKGYAEADPTLDINGMDTAHKLAILARLAFDIEINFSDIYVEGIENISKEEIIYGREMGYVLKLLAIAERTNGKISLRVHPCFVSDETFLADVEGAFNAVSVFGNAVGETVYFGRGAGMMPTASAVVADIIETAMGNSANLFYCRTIGPAKLENIENITNRFYIRLFCEDRPGVFARIGKILEDNQISISGLLQHEGRKGKNYVPVVITTHESIEKNLKAALNSIASLEFVKDKPVCIRIANIPEDNID